MRFKFLVFPFFLSCLLLVCIGTSCKRKKDFYLKGTVINGGNKALIAGAKVYFQDGMESGDLLGGTSPENFDSTTSDAEGKFQLGFKSKSDHGFVTELNRLVFSLSKLFYE